jgi:hypothetical protein
MPTIDVDGVIAFAILPAQAGRLVVVVEAAPCGRGEETMIDREARRIWHVDSAKVRIGLLGSIGYRPHTFDGKAAPKRIRFAKHRLRRAET